MVSRSLMPPPSWMGMSAPTAVMISFTTFSLRGLPAKAPLRSTTCSRRAPISSHLAAVSPALSENTVADFISPCCRRTHWPSLISIAGMINIVVWDWMVGKRVARGALVWLKLWIPVKEILIKRQTGVVTFFGMELGCENIIACDGGRKALAIVCHRCSNFGVSRCTEVTMHEIIPFAGRNFCPYRMRRGLDHLIPCRMRYFHRAIGRAEAVS